MSFTRSLAFTTALTLALAAAALADEPKASDEAQTPAVVDLAAGDALGLAVFADRMAAEAPQPVGLAKEDASPHKVGR